MVFLKKKITIVLLGLFGFVLQAQEYTENSLSLSQQINSPNDALWKVREAAFADIENLNKLSVTDPKQFRERYNRFFAELNASNTPTLHPAMRTSQTPLNPLVYALEQGQLIAKKITTCKNVYEAPKKIKEFTQLLKQNKLETVELILAPYIAHILANQLAVELNLRAHAQEDVIRKLFGELQRHGLDLYGQILIGILQQGRIGHVSPEILPLVITKSLLGGNFNTLRDIQQYENLLQQYPDKKCDSSYFHYIKYLDELMQQDATVVQKQKKHMTHTFYTLCTAIHKAADGLKVETAIDESENKN